MIKSENVQADLILAVLPMIGCAICYCGYYVADIHFHDWSLIPEQIEPAHDETYMYNKTCVTSKYSRTSLSRTRLFRITAYLEVKIWSLFEHETMTTCNKIMWKRGEIAPKEQFLLFSTLFDTYISNFRSQITYSFVKCGRSIYCFPYSLNSDMSR